MKYHVASRSLLKTITKLTAVWRTRDAKRSHQLIAAIGASERVAEHNQEQARCSRRREYDQASYNITVLNGKVGHKRPR